MIHRLFCSNAIFFVFFIMGLSWALLGRKSVKDILREEGWIVMWQEDTISKSSHGIQSAILYSERNCFQQAILV